MNYVISSCNDSNIMTLKSHLIIFIAQKPIRRLLWAAYINGNFMGEFVVGFLDISYSNNFTY